jgi:hypothetical protein
MEDDKICEVGNFLKIHFRFFWLSNSNPNLVRSKNKKKIFIILYIS